MYKYRCRSWWTVRIITVFVVSAMAGCGKERTSVHRAFYEWRSRVSYTNQDMQTFGALSINRLYLRLFDVQWKKDRNIPYPESTVHLAGQLPANVDIIPTIYVTNEVMKRVNEEQELDELATNTANLIREMVEEMGIASFPEVQIDCDWTAGSRISYFRFLQLMADRFPDKTLSATIRLHQIRYRVETGIPPVDRGMLMAYNVGQVTSPDETNSIFTEEEVAKYLGTLGEYPLPLDAALPIFSWAVRFHFDRYASLTDNVGLQDLNAHKDFEPLGRTRFRAIRNTELHGTPVFAGDIIRVEVPDRGEVLSIAEDIAGDRHEPEITLALYRYDSAMVGRFGTDYLQELYETFR